jgi:uroporphyrinogen-III synthase
MRLIVTRPAAQAEAWIARLLALGVDAVGLPLIGIEPLPDRAPLQAAWARLADARLVMFVSANAVAHFFDARPAAQDWPVGSVAGSTGPGTSAALRAAGVPEGCIVEPGPGAALDSEALWQRIQGWPWVGCQALVVRGEDGRDWLAEQLRQAGAQVDFVAAYRRLAPVLSDVQQALVRAALGDPAAHCWHFSSSESIDNLARAMPVADWSGSSALATHARIADNARRHGFGRVTLVGPTPEAAAAQLGPPAAAPTDAGARQGGR